MHNGNRYQPTLVVMAGIGMAGRDGKVNMDTLERFSSGDQAIIHAINCWMGISHDDWTPGAVFAFKPREAVAMMTDAAETLETIEKPWTDYRVAVVKLLALAKLAGARGGMLCVEVSAALPGRVSDIRKNKLVPPRRQASGSF
jgi:hypothetical protein